MQSISRFAPFILSIFLLTSSTTNLSAQSGDSGSNTYVIALLIFIGALILIGAVMLLSENLVQIEAKKAGMDSPSRSSDSLWGSISKIWESAPPTYVNGAKVNHLKKGHDILLQGEAKKVKVNGNAKRFSVRPRDFRLLAPIPRMVVSEGDEVKAGDVLFHDKKDDKIKYVAPVSGEVVEIRRGDKRSIIDVIILGDKEVRYKQFDPPSIEHADRQDIVDYLCETGAWVLINERPYDVVPDPSSEPRAVYISTFDSAPLAPDLNFVVAGKAEAFQRGIDTLARLTSGGVHLGLNARADEAPSSVFTEAQNCQKHWFNGKHPAGNVGVQIHHIQRIQDGESVWTINVQDVIAIGQLMYTGRYHGDRVVALAGAQIEEPQYYETFRGANIGELVEGNISGENIRVIDGDPLSGSKSGNEEFLSHFCDQVTVLEEGDKYEMFGWLLPLSPRPTISKTFPNFLFPNFKFEGETNTHGERRAFVVTGQYESVLPMDIYPVHLLKSIMANDYERMEGLGIVELSEEDLALCEFVCTSKIPVQKILREGLEMMREQG